MIGILISCREQYATIQDVPVDAAVQARWFFGLLDARTTLLTLRSILSLHGLSFPEDVKRIELCPTNKSASPSEKISGNQLYERASQAEAVLTDSLNSLVGARKISEFTLNGLQILKILSNSEIYLDGVRLSYRILFMFDDVHELAYEQRRAIRRELEQRDLGVARWIAQRSQAAEPTELLDFARTEGRDFAQIQIEEWARGTRGRGTKFFDLLNEIANRRAQGSNLGIETFESCLANSVSTSQEMERAKDAGNKVKEYTMGLTTGRKQFDEWLGREINTERELTPFQIAVDWRKLAIMVERHLRRQQLQFDITLPVTQLEEQDSSQIQTAAELFLAKEQRIPYYYGMRRIRQLSSWNIEQFLRIAGDLFEQVLTNTVLSRNRNRQLSASQQDSLLRTVSQKRLAALPREIPYGNDVQKLVRAIGAFCQDETYRPTAPYAPGVTGVAISVRDSDRLREASVSAENDQLERLSRTIVSAIANNVLEVRSEVKVKGGTWTVFFLNRMYCPVFELPLEYGGFRERPLNDLVLWSVQGFQSRSQTRLQL